MNHKIQCSSHIRSNIIVYLHVFLPNGVFPSFFQHMCVFINPHTCLAPLFRLDVPTLTMLAKDCIH